VHDPKGAFIDRDLYLFAFDRDGRYRAFSSQPKRVGTPLSDMPGLDAARLVRDGWRIADATGAGWVDYDIINRDTGVVTPKTSYVRKLDARTLIGCGIYKNLDAATASPVATQTRPPDMRKAA